MLNGIKTRWQPGGKFVSDVKGALHNNTPPLKCATRNVVRRKVKIPSFLSVFLTFYFLHAFIW